MHVWLRFIGLLWCARALATRRSGTGRVLVEGLPVRVHLEPIVAGGGGAREGTAHHLERAHVAHFRGELPRERRIELRGLGRSRGAQEHQAHGQ